MAPTTLRRHLLRNPVGQINAAPVSMHRRLGTAYLVCAIFFSLCPSDVCFDEVVSFLLII